MRQRQGYDDVASTLDMSSARVRGLAREALSSLAPASARRVDEDWRDQVADYVLGQQTGPESRATRGHLKRSETARTWVSSLLDSLDPLYGDGDRPEIPEADGASAEPEPRRRRRGGTAAAAGAAGAAAGAAGASRATEASDATETSGPAASRERDAAPPSEAGESPDRAETAVQRGPASGRGEDRGGTQELSPEARAVVRRRRIIGGAVAAGVVAIALAIVLLSGGDESDEEPERAARPAPAQNQPQARLLGQARLEAVGGSDAQGVAVVAQRGNESQLLVQARGLEPSGRGSAYEVWLYNSRNDAVSLGGQVTDSDGSLQGAGPLPANFRNYRFVDVSREKIDSDGDHSGNSVLRIPVADLLRGPAASGAGAGGLPGAGSAPGGGAP